MASPRSKEERPSSGKSPTHRPRGLTSGAARCRSSATGAVLSPSVGSPKRSHAIALADTPGRRAVSLAWPMSGACPEDQPERYQPMRWRVAMASARPSRASRQSSSSSSERTSSRNSNQWTVIARRAMGHEGWKRSEPWGLPASRSQSAASFGRASTSGQRYSASCSEGGVRYPSSMMARQSGRHSEPGWSRRNAVQRAFSTAASACHSASVKRGLAPFGFDAVGFIRSLGQSSSHETLRHSPDGAFLRLRGRSLDSNRTAVYTDICVRWGRAAVVMGTKLAYECSSVPQPPPTAARPAPPNHFQEA